VPIHPFKTLGGIMGKMSDLHIELQQNEDIVLCPVCKVNFYTPYWVSSFDGMPRRPATSRRDGKTDICWSCGVDEAIEDFFKSMENEKENQ
jgi:hypothetical protein